jgi:alkaline phosphatase D
MLRDAAMPQVAAGGSRPSLGGSSRAGWPKRATVAPAMATPRPANGDYPFTLGVASGDPTATGVVLWTRLAPRPFQPRGGMPDLPVPVRWEVARDERFRQVVRSGSALALPQLAHSVHVEVDGLEPDREWFYRFRYRLDDSPTGPYPDGAAGRGQWRHPRVRVRELPGMGSTIDVS